MTPLVTQFGEVSMALSTLNTLMLEEILRLQIADPVSPHIASLTYIAVAYEEALEASVKYVVARQCGGVSHVWH